MSEGGKHARRERSVLLIEGDRAEIIALRRMLNDSSGRWAKTRNMLWHENWQPRFGTTTFEDLSGVLDDYFEAARES